MIYSTKILKPVLLMLLFCNINPLFAQETVTKNTNIDPKITQTDPVSTPKPIETSLEKQANKIPEQESKDIKTKKETNEPEMVEKLKNRKHFFTLGIGVGGTYPSYGIIEKDSSNPIISVYAGYLYRKDFIIGEAGLRSDLDSRMAYGDFSLNGYFGAGYEFSFPNGSLPVEAILEVGSPSLSAKEITTSIVVRFGYIPKSFPVFVFMDVGTEYLSIVEDFGLKLLLGLTLII